MRYVRETVVKARAVRCCAPHGSQNIEADEGIYGVLPLKSNRPKYSLPTLPTNFPGHIEAIIQQKAQQRYVFVYKQPLVLALHITSEFYMYVMCKLLHNHINAIALHFSKQRRI